MSQYTFKKTLGFYSEAAGVGVHIHTDCNCMTMWEVSFTIFVKLA